MNHEHEHSHANSPSASAPHNDTIEPGQSSRSFLLRKPDHPVASGLVQLKARDANGVTDGAEDAVAVASSSSGSPLPDTLMRKFENSLGADLSEVRIHNGGASERAADAVGAKAYTMGNDIHFGAGHYDPSSSAGQHLLAHEVAHTMQQSGGAQRMQCKLEVSSPGDSLEQEADRAADAMVSGGLAPVSVTSSLSRQTLHRTDWFWPLNGSVQNNSSSPVTVWSDAKGIYTIPPHSSSGWNEDVDHVRDSSGQWWKIGAGKANVDSKGVVTGAKCKTSTYGKNCDQK